MARGNTIVVSCDPKGRFEEGYIASGETPKPGQILQRDPTVALRNGRFTYKMYNLTADGNRPVGALWVLREDFLQGKDATQAYAAGDRCFLYCPLPGDELNLLVLDVVGTGDDKTAGAALSVDDGTGKLVAGTGDSSPFQLLETITDPVADTLAWVCFGGF